MAERAPQMRWVGMAEACAAYDVVESTMRRRIKRRVVDARLEGDRYLIAVPVPLLEAADARREAVGKDAFLREVADAAQAARRLAATFERIERELRRRGR